MGAMPTRISVIVPVYNGARYLTEALDSVAAQGDPDLEVIVVDDGSTDESASVAEATGARVLRCEHRGIAASRQEGLEAATGEWIAWVDSDDLWTPGRLAWQRERLAAAPKVAAVAGACEAFHSPELSEAERAVLPLPPTRPGIVPGTVLMTGAMVEACGAFDPKRTSGEFIEWYQRGRDAGYEDHLDERVVVRRRLHAANHTRTHKERDAFYLALLRERLKKRKSKK